MWYYTLIILHHASLWHCTHAWLIISCTFIYKDKGKELGAAPAETTEIVETSDHPEKAVEKSEMPETTDSEVT